MSPFLFLILLFVPLFNTEPVQNEFETNDDLLMQRSVAANYLFGFPIRRYQHRLLDLPIDSSSLSAASDSDDQSQQQQQQRAKRIYWENLAFHAADYNQKGKKV